MSKPVYAMISTEMRRDLNDPLKYFEQLELHHLYNLTPWNDMVPDDFTSRNQHYRNARELKTILANLDPDIVQGVEPFALKTLPRVKAISEFVKSRRTPLIVVSLENLPFLQKYGPLIKPFAPIVREYVSLASLIIYINEGARDNFLQMGADPAKMKRLMYGCWGVDLEEFIPNGASPGLPESILGKRLIMFVGRVHRIKGTFELFSAFEQLQDKHRDTDLVMIGSGPAEKELKERTRRNGLDHRIHFLGTIKNKDLPAYLRLASVLAAPSQSTRLWAEQVGMVLIQAMACGVPVVSTTSGSISEFVVDGRTGLLVDERNTDALANALSALLSDEVARRTMGDRAREYALHHFDARKNVQLAEQMILASTAGYSTSSRTLNVVPSA